MHYFCGFSLCSPAPTLTDHQTSFFLMLGKHEGQVYIQTSESFIPAQEKPAQCGGIKEETAVQSKPQQITWRPYLTSSPSRTPTVVTKDLAVWNPLDYPFGKGL